MLGVERGQVDVWLAEPPNDREAGQACRWATILDDEERAQLHRFVFARDQSLYLAAHLALRTTLSLYAHRSPAAWRFVRNAYGRPEIDAARDAHGLRFNLSHTRGMVAVAIARVDDVGVDVENTCWREPPLEIADRYFAPAEVAELRALGAADQRNRFFDYWTLKESYIKARGMGLALPLDQFAFRLTPGESPRVTFDGRLQDDASAWQFALGRDQECHRLAIALHTSSALSVQVRRVCWTRVDEAVALA